MHTVRDFKLPKRWDHDLIDELHIGYYWAPRPQPAGFLFHMAPPWRGPDLEVSRYTTENFRRNIALDSIIEHVVIEIAGVIRPLGTIT